jgi:hypothetical protein
MDGKSRRLLAWVWAVTVAAAAITLICLLALAGLLWKEGEKPGGRGWYVSNRPDLTENVNREDLVYIRQRVQRYLPDDSACRSTMDTLQVVARLHPSEGLLFRLSVSQHCWSKLIRDKVRLPEPTTEVLRTLATRGHLVPQDRFLKSRGDIVYTYFDYVRKWPYDRVEWWPPPERTWQDIQIYRDKLAWDAPGVPVGTEFFMFLDPVRNVVWFLAW